MSININKFEWDLSLLFKSDEDSQIEVRRELIEKKAKFFYEKWNKREDYLKNPEILKEALKDYEELQVSSGGEDGGVFDDTFYFWLRTQKEQNNSDLKARYGKSVEFSNKINNKLRFFTIKISKISVNEQKKFLDFSELKNYRHFLERKFLEGKYLLSEEEEKIMNMKQMSASENWINMLSGFISKEEGEALDEKENRRKMHFSEIRSLMDNQNKKIRDSAALAFNHILKKNLDVAEAEINSILLNKKVDDELRRVKRPDELRHLADDIDSEIVDVMLNSVEKRFEIAKKYYSLKSKLLGVEKLEYHERNVSYGELDKKYSFEQSIELISKVFKNLDEKFLLIFDNLVKSGRVDVYPKKGKRDGAFCTDSGLKQLTYVMLNHTDKLQDVLTIAHEMGHAINSELMKEKRNVFDCSMPLSCAEVASTFMEDFVLEELEKKSDNELKFALMLNRLNDDVSTIFRQVACYRFEQELHKEFRNKGYLSKEEIGKIFQKNMFSYMGNSVENSIGNENWWVYWGHIRRFFYVYSYASGLLISKSMQKKLRENRAFIEDIKYFLSAGTSDSPKNIFLKLGLNIADKSFWNKGLDEIERNLNETEILAKKLGKI